MMMIVIWFCLLMSFIPKARTSDLVMHYYCKNTTSYTPNSAYKANLNSLLSNLYSNATRANGFYHATVAGSRPGDTVHGLFLCRGDVSAHDCQDCVGEAREMVFVFCDTEKTAMIWYANCMLRYSENPMFGIMDRSDQFAMRNPFNDTKPDELMKVVGKMLDRITTRASIGSVEKFAVLQTNFSAAAERVYALGQCTPDLSKVEWNKGKSSAKVIIASVVSVTGIILLFALSFCFLKMKRAKKSHSDVKETTSGMNEIAIEESVQYEFSTIEAITNGFSADNKIGEGGYGAVYKGRLPNGQEVAVKRLSSGSTQGDGEFKNEVALIAKLQHRNLVKLMGFCLESEEKILVYEFVPNKSLDYFLFESSPEAQDLIGYAWKHWKEDTSVDMVDQSLGGLYSRNEVIQCIHVGLLCVQEDVDARPTMANVVLMLNSNSATRRTPNPPIIFEGGSETTLSPGQ
nr:cysteine-rich receptor-like protein kinase 25 [Ipomoea batatas]